MKHYSAYNEKNGTIYHFSMKNQSEVRHWIINHLDLSLNWNIIEGFLISDLTVTKH